MKAPFPYFGGKMRVAAEVWRRFGDVKNYVEPFCGSCAVLLARPDEHQWWDRWETVNDMDGLLCNFWRAAQHAPEEVARWADWPVSELDLHARHAWLIGERPRIEEQLRADPEWYDAKAAGWWVWGIGCWIGGGWGERDHWRRVSLSGGNGVHRKLPNGRTLSPDEVCARSTEYITALMQSVSNRFRRVRVCCGDWKRVTGYTPTTLLGLTGVLLDPPYTRSLRTNGVYAVDEDCATEVREWCLEHGDDPLFRIALCGYAGEGHEVLEETGWSVYAWRAHGGMANQAYGRGRENAGRERIWFSPHCLPVTAERRETEHAYVLAFDGR